MCVYMRAYVQNAGNHSLLKLHAISKKHCVCRCVCVCACVYQALPLVLDFPLESVFLPGSSTFATFSLIIYVCVLCMYVLDLVLPPRVFLQCLHWHVCVLLLDILRTKMLAS